jgi:hypothetical protein
MKREVTILDSAARTATGTGDAAPGFAMAEKLGAAVVCSARSGTNPTLDVILQHSPDGTNWFDLITFTQLTAAGSEYKVVSEEQGSTVQVIGDRLRAKYTLGGTNPSFTFSVVVTAQE